MEHIDGEDLASVLRRVGRLTEDKALELGRQVCAGLAAAHAAGVLDRDLNPANVMLDSTGHARITDFGLAVVLASMGDEREVAGTPAYMAPEQIAGEPASAQTDIWSFGVLFFEILTGKRPFVGRSLAELARVQRESPPAPPSSVVSGIGPGVDAIVERCLAPDPRQRPRTAMDVLTALTGGDALGAAVAAGQTPSPDAVAAAGTEGTLRPATAWACFVGGLVCVLVYVIFLGSRFSVVEHATLERPPEVLAARAQEIVEQLGLAEPLAAVTCGFGYDDDAMAFLASHARPPGAPPSPIVFWCRQGSRRPVGSDPRNQITDREPPPAPGEVVTVLDPCRSRSWHHGTSRRPPAHRPS